MGRELRRRLDSTRFEGPHHEALLNLLLAAAWARERLDAALAPLGLTPPQFNVLRILRGVHPGGHARGDIARRLIERAPDVTRLLDRLERRGWIERSRGAEDRRRTLTRITARGLAVLRKADPAIARVRVEVARRWSAADAAAVSRLAEKLYGPG